MIPGLLGELHTARNTSLASIHSFTCTTIITCLLIPFLLGFLVLEASFSENILTPLHCCPQPGSHQSYAKTASKFACTLRQACIQSKDLG